MTIIQRLVREEEGQSLVEYGLILGLVSVGLIAGLTALKAPMINIFNKVTGTLNQASAGGSAL